MHTVWKGTISMGLVTIPVKLFSAVEDKDLKFRQYHKDCKTPISYKKVASCDDEVTPEEIIKVFETPNGRVVEITEEEMNKLKEEFELKTVSIIDFVKLAEIDPVYFDRTYYIGPDSGGTKAYALLSEILKKSKKIGLAKITIRSKQHLAAIRPYKNAIILETLHFPDEIRAIENLPGGVPEKAGLAERELQAGMMLVEQLTTTFNPENYTDTYRTALEQLISEKVNKNDYIATGQEKPAEQKNVVDLMSALQASIDRTKGQATPPKKPKTKAPKKATS
ncbi:Ku protein [Gottfriedia sp. NPDC057948]|uniref:non-homologous end joining protein Ku n=1 Tax=Gottfriedia sp. NPDC057948 TaxID=3346287 RepID=UPI0036DA744D